MTESVAVDGREGPEVVTYRIGTLLNRHEQFNEQVRFIGLLDLAKQVAEKILKRPVVVSVGELLHESPAFRRIVRRRCAQAGYSIAARKIPAAGSVNSMKKNCPDDGGLCSLDAEEVEKILRGVGGGGESEQDREAFRNGAGRRGL
jgi:hypothetical protein